MPVDLDDQLIALGAALMRDSASISIDELRGGELLDTAPRAVPSLVPLAAMRSGRATRRAWLISAAIATAAATVAGLVWIGERHDGSGLADAPLPGEVEVGVLALDPTAPVARSWRVQSATVDDLARWPIENSGVTRRYASDSTHPEDAPAIDVWVIDADAATSPLETGEPALAVQGVEAVWRQAGASSARQLSFVRDGYWFIVRGYRVTDEIVIAAAEHTHLSDDGPELGAVIDPEGLPDGVSELAVGVETELWLLPTEADAGDIPAVRWADGDRTVWLRSIPADDGFVRAQRVPASAVTDVTVHGQSAYVATFEPQPNLRWIAWSEGDRTYVLASNNVLADELVAFADALTPVSTTEWDNMVSGSQPDPSELAPVPVQSFPTVDETLIRGDGRGATFASYAQIADINPVAFPVLAVHRDVLTIAVNPEAPSVLAAGWPEVDPIDERRTFMIAADGELIDLVIDLGDGTSLTLGSATLTVTEMRAAASAVELVDRVTWEARWAPVPPYLAPAPPVTTPAASTELDA